MLGKSLFVVYRIWGIFENSEVDNTVLDVPVVEVIETIEDIRAIEGQIREMVQASRDVLGLSRPDRPVQVRIQNWCWLPEVSSAEAIAHSMDYWTKQVNHD